MSPKDKFLAHWHNTINKVYEGSGRKEESKTTPNKDAAREAGLSFSQLRDVSAARATLWHNGTTPPLSFRLMELAGEVGEACNAGKKLARSEMGMLGGTTDKTNLRDELADVVICADLVATQAGIDLGPAVVDKFNATSAKHGFPHRLALTAKSAAMEFPWLVRHKASNIVVAAFMYSDTAGSWRTKGYQIGHWREDELEVIHASTLREGGAG